MTAMLIRSAVCVMAAALVAGCGRQTPAPAAAKAPLYQNLGSHHVAITTASPEAQRYFDQGMTLAYAFNHGEAIRAFRQGAAIDPRCAMCYWGVAFSLSPNINAPITEEAARDAFAAIAQARQYAAGATDRERGFIEALATRYAADPRAERAPLDAAYAAAMRDLARRFPADNDAVTLFAQSLMDTSPWNYWTVDGQPRPLTPEVLAALESVLARNPDHLGAIHLYIHAVEASPNVARAEQYAGRLAALAPGAGHLVHMPSHVYLRTGRYDAASESNENAIKADAAYAAGDAAPGNMTYQVGYIPHNFHFLVTTASMEGRAAEAVRAAGEVRARMHTAMFRDPGMGGMVQHMWLTPLFTNVRFARWVDVLAEPAPPVDLPYMSAVSHAARGFALVGLKRLDEAERERGALAAIKNDPALKTLYVSSVNTAARIVAIADELLAGEIDAVRGYAPLAVNHLAQAVRLEDQLIYMEPPDWPIPARQMQGAVLLELGLYAEAEQAFLDDMKKFPENGWSLSGLQAIFERQARVPEAAALKTRLQAAWRRADVAVAGARAGRNLE